MDSSVVIAYLAIVLLISWMLRTVAVKEGMEEQKCRDTTKYGVCERPIQGPKDGEKTYPSIYGPNTRPRDPYYDNDTGKFESSTAADNTFYGNVLTPSTSFISVTPANLSNAFPTEGPPQPFLTDFKAFHK